MHCRANCDFFEPARMAASKLCSLEKAQRSPGNASQSDRVIMCRPLALHPFRPENCDFFEPARMAASKLRSLEKAQ